MRIKWNTRDLMVTLVIGLALGVLLIPVTYAYVAFLGVGGLFTRSLIGGIYFLPAVFAAYVVRKPGASFLASAIGGLTSMPFTPYGFIVLAVSILIGLVGELFIWLNTRYKDFALPRLLTAGAATGLAVFLLILGSVLRSAEFEWNALVLVALVLSGVTFAVCGLLAKALADAVARTGVLGNTALGKANVEEI
ncbi:MAG: ECF transporter S component [Anaerolineales bacterium]|nr:ECF transporter S component [Anaerolineales bacterium]MCW5855655.1 ECF transporter S component [Anaerolineales bacterium]